LHGPEEIRGRVFVAASVFLMDFSPDFFDNPPMTENKQKTGYQGFEQGPIRPPSEARSLLVRVTRNCHWNRCAFCPVYKGTQFSIRPVDHVLRDLEAVARQVEKLTHLSAGPGLLLEEDVRAAFAALPPDETASFRAALSWYLSGMEAVFLQDADSLVLRPALLIEILINLKILFPQVVRITSYSRSETIDRIPADQLHALAAAGLNRIHVGLESGCDAVLTAMHKGATKEMQIRAGLKVKAAGMELSEYYLPGLGGIDLWREHAQDTADAMNRINPDFIRLRTLAIPEQTHLAEEVRAGRFRKCPDLLVAEEILLFLDILEGVTGYLTSDHVLNLFPEMEGRLPDDLPRMRDLLWRFLTMEPDTRFIYQLGRRLGIMSRLNEVEDRERTAEVLAQARRIGATSENLDEITDAIVRRFI